RLYREQRPDVYSFATGGTPGLKRYRLKTIDVTVSGSRARSYALSYTVSGSTSRSVLSSVQQYGTDATLDASGNVTAGTGLPPVTTAYSGGGTGLFDYVNLPDPSGSAGSTWSTWNATGAQALEGDFDGDGRTDVALRNVGWTTTPVFFSSSK